MAMVQGYLMGLFESEKVLLDGASAESVYMMAGTDGVSGQFSNVLSLDWWDLTEGSGSISWGATYGYNDHSGGCKIVDTVYQVRVIEHVELAGQVIHGRLVHEFGNHHVNPPLFDQGLQCTGIHQRTHFPAFHIEKTVKCVPNAGVRLD